MCDGGIISNMRKPHIVVDRAVTWTLENGVFS